MLILDDAMLNNEVVEAIRRELISASSAFFATIQRYIAAIESMPNDYIKERSADVKDVANRITANLTGSEIKKLDSLPCPLIIIANDLTPSDTALLDRKNVLGFAVETGSRTSHTAILARSMRIPAVVGMSNLFRKLENNDMAIIDGYLGLVIINPEPETIALYKQKLEHTERLFAEILRESRLRAETLDAYFITLAANVEGVPDPAEMEKYGVEGIGLFRTEYLYMKSDKLPDENEQFEVYKKVAETMKNQPVVIRTLDIGGDKLAGSLTDKTEANPFLGMRAIRLCLATPELLKTQMRAILRAGVYGSIKMLFPMVSSCDELDRILSILDEVKNELMSIQASFDGSMDVGVMVEIPSAAVLAQEIAKKVDFFSIGSNDLVQYTLAVDRTNEHVADLYRPENPAVIRLIADTANAARMNGIPVACCGELAGDPRFAPLLAGLGIQELSMSPASIGPVRRVLRRLSMYDAEQLAKKVLNCRTAYESAALLQNFLANIAPDLVNIGKGF